MLHLPITKEWIISRAARRVYFACAIAAFSLFGVLLASHAALAAAGFRSFAGFPTAALVIRVLLIPGIAGVALLSVAMWYLWFSFDNSGWVKKTVWFVPLFLFVMLGPAFYYFLVYRRNREVAKCA
jgi:hypothetical protein